MSVLHPSDPSSVLCPPGQREGAARPRQLEGPTRVEHPAPNRAPVRPSGQQYGVELVLDLYDCDPATIRSARKLRAFVEQMCRLLDMKPFGRTHTPYFGLNAPHTAGYSLLQFIETSSITGHFSELTNAAYLNIFSCKPFDAAAAARFTRAFFGAKRMRRRILQRQ